MNCPGDYPGCSDSGREAFWQCKGDACLAKSIDFSTVADIYDDYVRVNFDIPFWIREAGRSGGRILELTAGTGRISIPLLKAGADLTCVDYCPEMLAVLKRKVEQERLTCTIIQMDITQLSLPIQYDFIFIPFNSFSEIVDRRGERKALTRIRDHLAEGGDFICTLQNPAIRSAGLNGNTGVIGTFPQREGGAMTVTSELGYEKSSGKVRGFQFYEFRDKLGKIVGQRSMEMSFRLFRPEEFEELAAHAGFEAVDLYGDYDYAEFSEERSPYMIWRLKSIER